MRLTDLTESKVDLLKHLSVAKWGSSIYLRIDLDQPSDWSGREGQSVLLAFMEMRIDAFHTPRDQDDMIGDSYLEVYIKIDARGADETDNYVVAGEWVNSASAKSMISGALANAGVPAEIAVDLTIGTGAVDVSETDKADLFIAFYTALALGNHIRGVLSDGSDSKVHRALRRKAAEFIGVERYNENFKNQMMKKLLGQIMEDGMVKLRTRMAIEHLKSLGAKWPEFDAILRSSKKDLKS